MTYKQLDDSFYRESPYCKAILPFYSHRHACIFFFPFHCIFVFSKSNCGNPHCVAWPLHHYSQQVVGIFPEFPSFWIVFQLLFKGIIWAAVIMSQQGPTFSGGRELSNRRINVIHLDWICQLYTVCLAELL